MKKIDAGWSPNCCWDAYRVERVAAIAQQTLRACRHTRGLLLATVWVVIVPILLSACNTTTSTTISTPTTMPTISSEVLPNNAESYAPWEDQLSLARKEAKKINSEAVLMWILTTYWNCRSDEERPEHTRYIFVTPTGQRISVEIEDTKPPSVRNVRPTYDTMKPTLSDEELQRYTRAVDQIKVGPREVCHKILPQVEPYWGPDSMITVSMFLDKDYDTEERFGTPSLWRVSYTTEQRTYIQMQVSPLTGEILSTEVEKIKGTQTIPTPISSK